MTPIAATLTAVAPRVAAVESAEPVTGGGTAPPAGPVSLPGTELAALIAAIPGSMEAAAAAPVVGVAGADPVAVSPEEALNLWTATVNNAMTAALVERIRQAGTSGATSTNFDLGLSFKDWQLSVNPTLTYTYTATVPINETITVPGRNITILGGAVGPINTSFSKGMIGLNVNQFSLPQTTLRVPDVTVALGSPDTTVDVTVTTTVGLSALTVQPGKLFDSSFTIGQIPISVDGAIALTVPFQATAAGPIQIDGFDLSGINGTVILSEALSMAGCKGYTLSCTLPFNVGVCSNPSSCNHSVHIPAITLRSTEPLLKGVIGGVNTSIPIHALGSIGPIGVTIGDILNPTITVAGAGGGAIPISFSGDVGVNIPITAKVGDLRLDAVNLETGSWTHNSIASSFALWQTNGNWPTSAPWSDDAGTNVIIPATALSIPAIAAEMPNLKALIGGSDTSIPINLTASIGATKATLQTFFGVPTGITVGAVGGGEIPVTVNADIPVNIPVRVIATPIHITGASSSTSTPDTATVVPDLAEAPVASTPTLARMLDGLTSQAVAVLDRTGGQLTAMAPNPLLAGLSGVLWQVREALAPVGADVGQWGSAACVATSNCSDMDLTGANLAGQYLGGVNFSRAVLDRANLTGANLGYPGTLEGTAKLTDASMRGAILTGVDDRNLRDALSQSQRVNLSGVDLHNRDLSRATLEGMNLSGANLTGANLQHAWLIGGVNLAGAALSGANFAEADLTGAKFTGATLTGATGLSSATLTGANFAGAHGVDLSGANFSGKDLTNTNLSGVKLAGATLRNAVLTGTVLTGADLSAIDPQHRADLAGVNLSGKDLTGTNFSNAYLGSAWLADADLTNANLSYANLIGGGLHGANLTGVVWKDTTCPDGSHTSSGCSAGPPIVIPAFQIGQGGLAAPIQAGLIPACYALGCVIPSQVGMSATFGATGTLPGASRGIVIQPITMGFLDSNNEALMGIVGGPGKGTGITLTAGAGPVTIPLTLVPPGIGPIPAIPWHSTVDTRVDIPVNVAVAVPRISAIAASVPYDVSTWTRTGTCAFSICHWYGWTGQISWASGDLGAARAPVALREP